MTKFHHVCSPSSLLNILREQRFRPVYGSPLAGDSGINGYIEGLPFNSGQEIQGRGAILIIEWHEDFEEIDMDKEFPLSPNKLFRQGNWRAIIPAQTESKYIKVVGFETSKSSLKELSIWERIRLHMFKRQLKDAPIFITLQY